MRGAGPKLVYILIGAGAVLTVLSSSGIRNILQLHSEIERIEERLEAMEKENERLRQELEWIETEDEYLEYLARKRLGLIKPGETKYYIVPGEEE